MNRDELLQQAILNLSKASEAGGYIGISADIAEVVTMIQRIRIKAKRGK